MEHAQELLKNSYFVSAAFYDQQAQNPDQFAYNNNKTNNSSPPSGADDGTCKDSNPFAFLATKMQDVTKDGGIKKMVLYGGYGPILQDMSVVSIWYEAHLEYDHLPFDAAVMKWKSYTFSLGQEDALATLSLAVQTMKLYEVSQFLIRPIYVFGTRGFLKPVPPHSTILLDIAITNAMKLSPINSRADHNQECYNVNKYARALSSKAKDVCDQQLYSATSCGDQAQEPDHLHITTTKPKPACHPLLQLMAAAKAALPSQ